MFFEYLNIKRPLLATICTHGVAAELIHKANAGVVANYDNPYEIADRITDMYNLWKNDALVCNSDDDVIKQYERKNLTAKLAYIFDGFAKEEKII